MIAALIAAFTNATETILDKVIMTREKVGFTIYMTLQMFFIFIFTTIFYLSLGSAGIGDLTTETILAFLAVVGIAYIYNFLYFFSLKHEKISDIEPLAMLHPLVAILFAAIFYTDERNIYILFFALVAAITLVISRIEKHHLKLNKYSVAMVGFVVLISLEGLFLKNLLEVFSPAALYALRVGIITILFAFFLKPRIRKIEKKGLVHIAGVGLIVAIQYVALYYAISKVGLVLTSLISILAPVLILLSSKVFLKEKIGFKKGIADAIILFCITGALLSEFL